jgi:hypothetical protein
MQPLRGIVTAINAPLGGGLALTLDTAAGAVVVFVPAGPLAAQLAGAAGAADVGERWELTLADDGRTVIAARFCAELPRAA